jgi:hypothetical protein
VHQQLKITPGQDLIVAGRVPAYEDFERMGAGLVEAGEPMAIVDTRIHFIIDMAEALVIWMSSGCLYQKRMSLVKANRFLGTLQRCGFTQAQTN